MPLKNVKELESRHLLGAYSRYDVLIDRGSGVYLYDRNNKRYLDMMAGIGVNALGYNHPRIRRVLRKQIKRPLHLSNLLYHEHQGRLGARLCEVSGLDRAFFTNSGTESIEGCLKFSRVYANQGRSGADRRFRVLALEGSFHGRSFGAVSATHTSKYREPFEPLVPGFEFVAFDDVEDLARRFDDGVSAVVFETLQGEGGIRPISEQFYRTARRLTRETGAALISDEIQCGLGRTGRWFGFHKFADRGSREELPDLVAVAKPLAGGLPLGAVLMKEEVAGTIDTGIHGTTFGGGPLACRVAIEVLKTLEEDGIIENARQVGAHFRVRLEELRDLPVVKQVRGDGLMLGVELSVAGRPVVDRLLEAGFIINCTRGSVLRILPPLIITSKQVDRFVRALRTELEELR